MAVIKISELPDATLPLSGNERIEAVQDGVNVGITLSDIEGGGTTTVNGTVGRISVSTVGSTSTVNIDAAYSGQASISTLGTVTTGTWNATAIADAKIASSTTWNAKAGTVSPAFTGTPTAPTAADGTDTDQIATTAFVQNAIPTLRNPRITDATTLTNIENDSNWTVSGVYTGPAISAEFGDEHYDSTYWYRVMFDNVVKRFPFS